MAQSVRIELDSEQIGQFLATDPGIEAMLRAKIAAIAAQAGEGVSTRVYRGRDRLRAQAWTATQRARINEAYHRSLTKALDAAR